MNGAELMLNVLQRHGIADAFGYPGGAIMPVYDALYQSDIKHYLCRHEQGAAFAALGYSRASGKLGVCLATSGPGVTNLLTGLADAFADSIPVLAITGQVASSLMGTDAFQEVDVLSLSLSITKHCFQVTDINELEDTLEEAIYLAQSGRPGPVIVDIPKDIQLAETHSKPNLIKSTLDFVAKDDAINKAKAMLKDASQPILYVGGGVNLGKAVESLRHFHQTTGIPAVCTLKGLGTIEPSEQNYLGMLGMHGTKTANIAVQECDLLISVGARFDDRVTGKLNEFAPNAKVIHLDIDPAEMNKLRQTNVSLLGNLNFSLKKLSAELAINDWQETCKNMLHEEQAQHANQAYESKVARPTEIDVTDFLNRLSHKLPQNTVVTTDVGQHQMWVAQHMRFSHPQNFLTSGGLGSMGYGLPAAIGAQLSRTKDCVVAISGDGSIMMNIQELATVNRFSLPLKLVVVDNSRLGMVRQWQELFFEERFSETDLSDNPDFVALAKVFNIEGLRVEHRDQIDNAIDQLVNHPGAFLLHLCINETENVWPLVPPNTANHNMLEKRP